MNTSAIGTMMMPSITRTVGSSGNVESKIELNGLLTLQKLADLHSSFLHAVSFQWSTGGQHHSNSRCGQLTYDIYQRYPHGVVLSNICLQGRGCEISGESAAFSASGPK